MRHYLIVSPPIHALPRFSLVSSLVIMLGLVIAETTASWLINYAYNFGVTSGLYAWSGDDPSTEAALTIIAKLLAFAAVTQFILRRSHQSWHDLGHARWQPWLLAAAFLPIIAGITIFLSEIDNAIRAWLPEFILNYWDYAPGPDELLEAAWLGPILAVVVAPITEEIVFRGLILRGLLGRWQPRIAITVSAVLFALMHFNPAQVPIAVGLGLVLGWVYVRTRSLGLCILGHALNNASSYMPGNLPFEIDGFNRVSEDAAVVFQPWWFDATGLLLIAGGLTLIHKLAPPASTWRAAPPTLPPLLPPPILPSAAPAITDLGIRDCHPAPATETPSPMAAALVTLVTDLAQRARAASLVLATTPTPAKNAALTELARLIEGSTDALLAANARDLDSPEALVLTPASRDRLTLDASRLAHLAHSVREVVALPDPVGILLEETTRPNGLHIRKVRVPIGVIGIIYESRPNVTVDCAILCLKSGNAAILRGGKECFHTNTALAALIQQALASAGLPAHAVQLVPTTDRAALTALLKLDTLIHCIIPRGGEGLIRFVTQNSTIPVIKHYKGVCFVYADAAADLAMAELITVNAKVTRPSACNAAEQLLVHHSIAHQFIPAIARALHLKNVELRCDPASAAILTAAIPTAGSNPPLTCLPSNNPTLSAEISPSTADAGSLGTPPPPVLAEPTAAAAAIPFTSATEADYSTEFLDAIIAIRVVDSLEHAIAIINRDSSSHSDAIVTNDEPTARRFLAEVDSATVFWNVSTRFNDGFEFGFGAEIGISTDRLHARGPMGLPELCSYKYLITGNGQIRP